MAESYKEKYFKLKEQEEAQLKSDVDVLKRAAVRIERKIDTNTSATTTLADHVKTQNGRIGKLEGGKTKFPMNDKALILLATAFLITVIVVAYLVGAGDLVKEVVK